MKSIRNCAEYMYLYVRSFDTQARAYRDCIDADLANRLRDYDLPVGIVPERVIPDGNHLVCDMPFLDLVGHANGAV